MKKALLISALILTIVSSLVAGTMATYTKTLDPIKGEVTAKQFFIEKSETAFANVKLAPSEETQWNFSIVNFKDGVATDVTEVDMNLNINVVVDGAIDGLNVGLYEGDTQLGETVVKEGNISFDINKAFIKNVSDTRNFSIKVLWVNGQESDVTDTANADDIAKNNIAVTVTGTQNLEG
jgi:hypothetical protein